MAALEDFVADAVSNYNWKVYESLYETKNEQENLFRKIEELHIQIKKFKDIFQEKATAADVSHYSTLDIISSVSEIFAELLQVLRKLQFVILKKMEDLQIFFMREDDILCYDENNFWKIVSQITENQKLIAALINDLNANKNVCLFRELMDSLQTMKSE